ncbi:MAG: helix-turn-helix domain-containing protein, partial [Ruminococcus sp.]|nr:helix-turn-helix domain-containing protein [Ruminococcus sp.]
MIYGEKLRKLRDNSNLIQADLAKILNINKDVYGQYEREYVIIPIKHLNTLCNYFNISLDYIFSFSNTKQYENSTENINKIEVGKRLKEFRKDNNLTQVKLAKLLNIANGTIADYETGRRLIATPFLYTICSKYKISADYLLGKIDNP